MTVKYFNVKNGLTAGPITLDATSGNATATNLSVTGISDLGAIANVNITGGVSGQAIITDGTGNLSFGNVSADASAAPMPTYIADGNIVTISANYQGLFGYPITVDGTLIVDGILIDVDDSSGGNTPAGGFNTQLQYNDAGSLAGIATVTYDGTKLSLGNVANVKLTGGSNGQVLSTDGTGNLSWTTSSGGSGIPGGVDTQVQFNDASSFGGNAGFTFNKTTGIFTAPFLAGNGNGLSNIQGANVSGAVNLANYATTANSVAGANVSGQVNFAATANAVAGANVSGAVSYAATANSVAGANVSGAVSFATTANSVDAANISGTVNLANFASTANAVAGANVSGQVTYAATANAVAGANVSGQVANALVAGTVYTNAQPNITSTGTLSSVTVSGNANVGNLGTGGLITATGNITGGNIITGGIVSATGNGTFGNVTATTFTGALSGAATSATTAGTVTTAAQPNITSVGTLTSLTVNGNISANNANITGNIVPTSNNIYSLGSASSYWKDAYIGPGSLYINGVKVLEESSNAIVISADLNQTVKVTSSGSGDVQLQTTGTGVVAVKGPLQIQAANYITSSTGGPIGFSNPINVDTLSSLSANTNLTISANGTGNIQLNDDVTIAGNLTINGVGGNLSVTSLTVEDNIIDISAETTGVPVNNAGIRVIRGDEAAVQLRWNETTDTWQTTNDGSIYFNIVGSNTTTGNANVGNIGATGGIFTTVAGSLTTNAQPNITSTGTLSSVTVSGNANVGNLGTTNLVASGTGSFSANVNMNSQYINNLGYPTANTDAASKQYVDTMVSTGISYHQPVNVATTTTLATATGGTTSYNSPNGAANGVGAYISTTGTFLNIDGANVQTVGTRILVKNEANATWNGVYTYANTTAIVRSIDTDTYGLDINQTDHLGINDYFFTLGGVVNEGTSFIVSAPTGTITFGTSNIEFSTFSTSQVYDAGTGLTLTGTTFSVNTSQTQVTEVGTLSSLSVSGNANVGNIGATNGVFTNVSGNGSALTSIAGGNVTGQVSFAATANAVAGGNVSGQVGFAAVSNSVAGANVSGAVSFATTANSVAGANVSGAVSFATTANAVAGANVSGAVNLANFASTANAVALANVAGIGNISSININGNASTILYGNGVFAAAPVTYGNANVATFLASYGSNTITTTGNISVGNIIGNGQALTGLAGANVTGTVASATTAGTVTTAAQPNITSVGTLTSLAVTGNISAGNVSATTFTGALTGLASSATVAASANSVAGANVSGAVGLATFAGTANAVAGANVSGTVSSATTAGTVTTAAQGNITSVGTLSSLTVSGNITGGNLTTAGTLTAGTVTETSGLALKENFRPIENPLEKVLQLLGQIYDRKDGSSKDEAGLVAEDVYKIIPNLVKTDGNGNPESVFYSRLSVYLLESIKVLNDEIAILKGKKRKSKK